ncbi:MAG: hypothetical protein HOY79_33825 [Streptomyces sp.]|nr:hypothetical protein [Streptomyces sp.]NUS11328.1 hypothetical protein [Streptomyces sp.]NUS23397.1 hypothetical protein [Streptomyces sp.]
MRYSVESTILPTTAPDLLEWAAAHVESRGFHDGRDGHIFARGGGITTTRLLKPGILGALDVAGGDGRMSSARTYDYPAIRAAERLALDVVADLVSGGAVVHDLEWADEARHRRGVVHRWGMQEERTGADVAALFREAAEVANDALTAATRPGRPPRALRPVTLAGVLEWAAAHVEEVGHRAGEESHDPAGHVDSAACTMLHALDRALVAATPSPSEREAWEAYWAVRPLAFRVLVGHLMGGDLDLGDDDNAAMRWLRGVVLMWGNFPDRSTEEVAAAFRAAIPADVDDTAEEPVEPGQAAFF